MSPYRANQSHGQLWMGHEVDLLQVLGLSAVVLVALMLSARFWTANRSIKKPPDQAA